MQPAWAALTAKERGAALRRWGAEGLAGMGGQLGWRQREGLRGVKGAQNSAVRRRVGSRRAWHAPRAAAAAAALRIRPHLPPANARALENANAHARTRRWHQLASDAAEDVAAIMTAECGKPLAEARAEIAGG